MQEVSKLEMRSETSTTISFNGYFRTMTVFTTAIILAKKKKIKIEIDEQNTFRISGSISVYTWKYWHHFLSFHLLTDKQKLVHHKYKTTERQSPFHSVSFILYLIIAHLPYLTNYYVRQQEPRSHWLPVIKTSHITFIKISPECSFSEDTVNRLWLPFCEEE